MAAFRDLYVLKDIRASRVNLIMNDFAAGLPSPLSCLGLGDLLCRNLGLEPWSARVLPILHRVFVSEGRTKPEMENKKSRTKPEMENKSGNLFHFIPIETVEDMTGTVELSLLLHLPGCKSESLIREQLVGCRIAGGLIQNEKIEVKPATPDGSAFCDLRRGYAMIRPETPERRKIATGDQEDLAAIAATLFPVEPQPGFGWIVPSSVGYRLLEDPETAPQRIRTRSKEVPHVFAEPVLGIAELVSERNSRLTELTETGLDALFWSWDARDDLVLGHSAYHPDPVHSEQPKEAITHD